MPCASDSSESPFAVQHLCWLLSHRTLMHDGLFHCPSEASGQDANNHFRVVTTDSPADSSVTLSATKSVSSSTVAKAKIPPSLARLLVSTKLETRDLHCKHTHSLHQSAMRHKTVRSPPMHPCTLEGHTTAHAHILMSWRPSRQIHHCSVPQAPALPSAAPLHAGRSPNSTLADQMPLIALRISIELVHWHFSACTPKSKN